MATHREQPDKKKRKNEAKGRGLEGEIEEKELDGKDRQREG